jgi:hypothetical protein
MDVKFGNTSNAMEMLIVSALLALVLGLACLTGQC